MMKTLTQEISIMIQVNESSNILDIANVYWGVMPQPTKCTRSYCVIAIMTSSSKRAVEWFSTQEDAIEYYNKLVTQFTKLSYQVGRILDTAIDENSIVTITRSPDYKQE